MRWQTKRLLIRPYEKSDAPAVFEVINDESIYEMTLHIPYPYPKEQVPIWIHFTQKNSFYKKGYECGIFNFKGQYIGNIGLVNIDYTHKKAEMTYFIGKDYRNEGYATEALAGLLYYAFRVVGLERVSGSAMCHNQASIKVMEKNHLRCEGVARHEILKDGEFIDVWHGAILKDEFEAIKKANKA